MAWPFCNSAKTAPSAYPRFLFHGLRFCQLASSLVVGAITSYFIWHLVNDHWPTPWTFILLMSVSLASIAALSITILIHCCIGLQPHFNIVINSLLAVFWAVSYSLLTWYMSGTLADTCDLAHWQAEVGVAVCRLYKTLFTFTLAGLVSTLAALALDLSVRRQQTSRGIYRLPDTDVKIPADHRADAFSLGEWYTQKTPREEQSEVLIRSDEYVVPAVQFRYHDTGYYGGSG